jgi:FkbM family methyltransferase
MKQHILNRILPMSLRRRLRQAALRTIPSMRHLDMRLRLVQLARNGFQPQVIYDIGASTGEWARMVAGIWPQARIFGFEPNAADQPALEQTRRELPNFSFRRCFLGPAEKTVRFHSAGVATSVLDPSNLAAPADEAPMLTIDRLVAERQIPPPDFMKTDVQGYELSVLGGASDALAPCQAVLLEVSFFRFLPGSPLADEVIRFMRDAGFVWYDIVGCLRRPFDDALAQMDLLFVREENPLRASGRWE